MRSVLRAAACLFALLTLPATAHEFSCRQTFNGQRSLIVDSYPAQVTVRVVLYNRHPSEVSVALAVSSALMPPGLFETPLTVGVGASHFEEYVLTIGSYEECVQLSAPELLAPPSYLSTVDVFWENGGRAQCSAELICQPAVCP